MEHVHLHVRLFMTSLMPIGGVVNAVYGLSAVAEEGNCLNISAVALYILYLFIIINNNNN
jgi:hypothetical protein